MKKLIIYIVLLSCYGIITFTFGEEAEIVSGILRYKADSPDNLRLIQTDGNAIMKADTVFTIYSNNSYRQLWDEGKINELVKAIIDIRRDGLDPYDYHLKTIINSLNRKKSTAYDYPEAMAELDIVLTDALTTLISDISSGRVESKELNYGWEINNNESKKPLSLIVSAALKSSSLYDYIESTKPKLNFYKNLKKALNRIQFLTDHGGWEKIPDGVSLKRGMRDERIVKLRNRLISTNHLTDLKNIVSDYYDESLEMAVKNFQVYHNLNPDGIIGPNTLRELNVSAEERVNQIKVNLERARWVSDFNNDRNVIVNIAGFRAYYTDDGKVLWSSRLQVGKPYRKTPIFKSEIKYMVFNPSWSVPPVILKNDILPAVKRDPSYLASRGLEVYSYEGRKVSPYDINWSNYSGSIPYSIKQKPGPRNALGRVKFMFPNNFSVYLHDTPNKHLFNKDIKTFSSGCIRIENPFELAELLLNDSVKWNSASINKLVKSRKTRTVYLEEPVQIMIMYWTASADSKGNIYFMNDIYGRDKQLLRKLLN